MSTVLASTPGATAPGAATSATAVPDRVVDRAVPAAVALRLIVLVSGLVVVLAGGARLSLGIALGAVLLAGDAARHLLRPAARSGLLVSLVAVVGSGGWWSPFAAVLAVDVALAGLARGYRRALVVAVGVTAVCLAAGVTTGPVVAGATTTPLPLLLLLGASLGGYAHGLAADRDHPDLGHRVHLADANRLAADLHATLRALPTAPDVRTVATAAISWLTAQVPSVAAAVVVEDAGVASVAAAVGTALDADGATALLADAPDAVSVTTTTGGRLTSTGRAIAWSPLDLRGRRLGVLVIEHDDDLPAADVTAALTTLAGPLSLALDTARWFARLSVLAGELERSRLAGDLADRLCQSMAATVFALDRAAARNGDVELFRLADGVRCDVADLRRTLDDLRANVAGDADLTAVVGGCVHRAGERGGYLTTAVVAAAARASRPVEQQLLRALQELLAVVAGATAVDVTWRSDTDALVVTVRHDGTLDVPPSVPSRADTVGATVSTDPAAGVVVLSLATPEVQP